MEASAVGKLPPWTQPVANALAAMGLPRTAAAPAVSNRRGERSRSSDRLPSLRYGVRAATIPPTTGKPLSSAAVGNRPAANPARGPRHRHPAPKAAASRKAFRLAKMSTEAAASNPMIVFAH